MNLRDVKRRIDKLKKEIERYRYSRLVLNKELISAEVEDSLKKELFDLEQKFPEFVTPDSPTQRIGGEPLKEFLKIRHEKPMLSFNDGFSEEDMRAWFLRLKNYLGVANLDENFYCELKIDGLAIELVYENGVFVRGSTRGNGLIGEDITQNLRTIENIPLRLDAKDSELKIPGKLVVRGEVFITKKEFERINKEQVKRAGKIYANPRNIAAGSVRQLDPKITASRKLDTFIYDVVTDLGAKTHEEIHELLKKMGFKTNPNNRGVETLEGIFKFRNYWEEHREKLEYEVDGVVVILNKNEVFLNGGVIGKAPRAAIAYKFSPKEATTIVENIKVQIGRTGALTPVADLRPVQVGGVTISHATLHNYDEIKRLGLKIGDTVIVSRAGDVIPQVMKVLTSLRTGKEKEFKMPSICPVDGSKVIKDGVILRCGNKRCGARQRESMYHFVSRSAFGIEGLGPKIIDRFLDEGLIADAADIFFLRKGDIEVLERFGEKSAENIISEIAERKKIPIEKFIYGLGILHVGEETAQLLAKQVIAKIKNPMPTGRQEKSKLKINEVLKIFQNFSLEDLQKIRDIGPKVAQSIYDYFRDKRHEEFIKKLDKAGVVFSKSNLALKSAKLSGKIFVLTGSLESMPRDEAKAKIRALGGEISESVSKNTDFVVTGAEPGSKYEKAKRLGVKIINEKEFLALLARGVI